jgi:hypothetical protein
MTNQIDTMIILSLIFVKGPLSCRTFCPAGRFVPTDVLSAGCFVRRTLGRRTFCPYGRFVTGRFVWAPKILVEKRLFSTPADINSN